MFSYLELTQLKTKISEWIAAHLSVNNVQHTLFISYGNRNQRCKVWSTTDIDKDKLIKRANNFVDKLFAKNASSIEFFKLDIVQNIEKKPWNKVSQEVEEQIHNNHYRKGISFDENFEVCFLEQEIYGRAIIRGVVYNQPNFFDEKNLNDSIKKKYLNITKHYDLNTIKNVWVFDTIGAIYENGEFISLQSQGCENGVRLINSDKKQHIKQLIGKNADFLHNQILDNGQFIYGYFPAFDREIKSYNTVRHCTSVYALIETFEIEERAEYWPKVLLAIQYAIENLYQQVDTNIAHMIDGTDDNFEIKLGANAAAILMLSKYQEVTGNNEYQHYAEALANGIRAMIDSNGETTHVLHYPSLEIKEKFRTVYYDGEGALALLRLYQLNRDEGLLATVKLMFEHFIAKNYEKYHDHWLSYCTNELTKFCPEEKYFQFGLNNYLNHMKFIRNRKTVYATFLEMMMTAYKMVVRIKEQGDTVLFEAAQFNELNELIELRAEFQRNGFFYPEVAMYMQQPYKVLNAFYVRHDRFRTRIDDQEHNLSGYIAYYLHFKGFEVFNDKTVIVEALS